jgi:TPP-dependent pyruvate/acetoin dehydrogenase alpha subunit
MARRLPIGECRVHRGIADVAAPFGMRGIQGDGNDVLQVLDVARDAVDSCRRGEGPRFVEFNTYRLRGHVGPDDNIQGTRTDIRPAAEIEAWRARDPIPRLEQHLALSEGATPDTFDAIKARVRREVSDVFAYAAAQPRPSMTEVTTDVFRAARA